MYPQLTVDKSSKPQVKIKTNMGDITCALFPKLAPKAAENFISLAKNGYYDGTIFHRVINEFMIQGGDPTGTGMGGESIWKTPFQDEFSDKLFNLRGALSMANAGPNTNGSQFFIVQGHRVPFDMFEQMEAAGYPQEIIDAYRKGGTPWLDQHHTVFGQVVSGMDVVDKIANTKTVPGDKPLKDVVIEGVDVIE